MAMHFAHFPQRTQFVRQNKVRFEPALIEDVVNIFALVDMAKNISPGKKER